MRGLALIVEAPTEERPVSRYRVEEFDGDGDALRAVLGGLLEAAPADESVTVWVNEEGKLDGLPVNRLAMDVWVRWDVHRCILHGRDWLAGNVVVTGGTSPSGRTLDLPEDARRWILRVARDAGAETPRPDWNRFGLVDREEADGHPCRDCGRTDLPLHTDYRCPECHEIT